MAHSTKSTGSRIWASRPFQSLRLWWNLLISIAVICCQARAIPLTVDEPVRPASVAEKIWHSLWLVGSEKCYTLLYCNRRCYLTMKPDHFIDHLQERRKIRVKSDRVAFKVNKLTGFVPKVRDAVPEVWREAVDGSRVRYCLRDGQRSIFGPVSTVLC